MSDEVSPLAITMLQWHNEYANLQEERWGPGRRPIPVRLEMTPGIYQKMILTWPNYLPPLDTSGFPGVREFVKVSVQTNVRSARGWRWVYKRRRRQVLPATYNNAHLTFNVPAPFNTANSWVNSSGPAPVFKIIQITGH